MRVFLNQLEPGWHGASAWNCEKRTGVLTLGFGNLFWNRHNYKCAIYKCKYTYEVVIAKENEAAFKLSWEHRALAVLFRAFPSPWVWRGFLKSLGFFFSLNVNV